MKIKNNDQVKISTNSKMGTIRQNRDRYISFAFASAHLFIEINRAGIITYAAGAVSALVENNANELLGREFIDFVDKSDDFYFREILSYLLRNHRVDPRPIKIKTTSNATITLMMGGFIMPDEPAAIHLSFNLPPKTAGGNHVDKINKETGLLNHKDFEAAAKEQLDTASKMGQESKLTLFVLEGLAELKESADPTLLARALEKISSYLRAISLDGGTATQFDDEKFGLMHDPDISEEQVKQHINSIIEQELGAAPVSKSFGIDFDPGELGEEDAAKALSYSINKFMDSDPENFSISSIQNSAKEMMADTLGRISKVRNVIEDRNFDVVYQPIVDLYMEETHHLEALTRVTGLDSPQAFISFTEEVGLIEDFDLALAQKVLDDLSDHAKTGWTPKIAINLSARSMSSSIFVNGFNEILKPFDHVKKQLMLELTETVNVTNFSKLNEILQHYRKQGIEVCLDDVGSGSTSFQSLYDLEVDYLKIEGKFVREAADNPRDMAMLNSIIKNGKQLGCKLIAEQIETRDQARLMSSLDIDYGQGFLYGRPTTDHSMLRTHKTATQHTPNQSQIQKNAAKNKVNKPPAHHISMNLRRSK